MYRESPNLSPNRAIILIRLVVETALVVEDRPHSGYRVPSPYGYLGLWGWMRLGVRGRVLVACVRGCAKRKGFRTQAVHTVLVVIVSYLIRCRYCLKRGAVNKRPRGQNFQLAVCPCREALLVISKNWKQGLARYMAKIRAYHISGYLFPGTSNGLKLLAWLS